MVIKLREKPRAVSDTGPILHLQEINSLKSLKMFRIFIAPEVENEIRKLSIRTKVNLINIKPKYKDLSKILSEEYIIDLGEAESISLALQENIKLLFTDDLETRDVGKKYGLEIHGTLGLLLRAFREGLFTKKESVEKVYRLYRDSTLFLTEDLVKWIVNEIEVYDKK